MYYDLFKYVLELEKKIKDAKLWHCLNLHK
jgi:hypothetical protein